jgi:hypothetical protein
MDEHEARTIAYALIDTAIDPALDAKGRESNIMSLTSEPFDQDSIGSLLASLLGIFWDVASVHPDTLRDIIDQRRSEALEF